MKLRALQHPAAVVAASAVGAFGIAWRGLGQRLLEGTPSATEVELPLEPFEGREAVRARKLMSRGARLAALAIKRAVEEAGWSEGREEIGAFMGVGASGGSMEELQAMLGASREEGRFSLARFGDAGLAACNPLFAFQLMNNFTLCHGSILEGLGGPNAAFFSRGSGTVCALVEALHALAEGDCTRALAGGSDSALHPVTRAELGRGGFLQGGLVPSEGAALLALASTSEQALAWVEAAGFAPESESSSALLGKLRPPDLVVLSPWGRSARAALQSLAAQVAPAAAILDSSVLGESLAAAPALSWVAAVDRLASGEAERALVLSSGIDGDLGAVLLTRSRP